MKFNLRPVLSRALATQTTVSRLQTVYLPLSVYDDISDLTPSLVSKNVGPPLALARRGHTAHVKPR